MKRSSEHYDSVIWLSTTGDVLNAAQQTAFEEYIRAGGGYTGIHAAADTEYEWSFYHAPRGGVRSATTRPARPTAHGGTCGRTPTDHSTQGLPAPNWTRGSTSGTTTNRQTARPSAVAAPDYSPRPNVHVLIALDESTYAEDDGNDGVDDDHPISWCQRYEGGRSWYTGMGHTAASFTEANYLKHILGGIEVSAGVARVGGVRSDRPEPPVVQGFADPATGPAPLEVQFSVDGGRSGRRPADLQVDVRRRWQRARVEPCHTYTKPGTYTATVTVRDPDGNVGTTRCRSRSTPPGNQIPMVVTRGRPDRRATRRCRCASRPRRSIRTGRRTGSSTAGTSATAARCSAATSGTRTWSRAPTRRR